MAQSEIWLSGHDKITEALSSCTHILIALTPNATASKWVRAEVNWAFEHMNEMQILPVLIKNCEIERLHLLLKNFQYFDFLGNPAKAANSLLMSLRIEPKSVSQLLGHDLSESLFGGVIGFTLIGAILAGLVAIPIHFSANVASRLTGWEPAPLKHWIFGGAAIAAVIGGIAGVFYATKDNNRLTVLYLSLLDKLFRGAILGVLSWAFSWIFGLLGGWSPYPLLLMTVICAVGLGVYDLLDTVFMLFEKSLFRRMNTEIFLWNTVGVIFASSVWALSTIAFGNVGTWGTWAICEVPISSTLAVVSASVAASTSS